MLASRSLVAAALCLAVAAASLGSCSPAPQASPAVPGALSPDDINLVFVSTPDLANQAPGDVNPDTANLTNQGLGRSLQLASYLKDTVLGGRNVNRIYALAPMTHLQTDQNLPDMAALAYIEQFAALNSIALTGTGGYGSPTTPANGYPIGASYGPGALPAGVPVSPTACPGCQGLEFGDPAGNNEALAKLTIQLGYPGYFVFAAPWETLSPLMAAVDKALGAKLAVPTAFPGPNTVTAISISPAKTAALTSFDAPLTPAATAPVLPAKLPVAACPSATSTPKLFTTTATGGVDGAVTPPGINTNQTVYFVRHGEAHPIAEWSSGNVVAQGWWRALGIPTALEGKINPTQVWSIDPAQVAQGDQIPGNANFSYVRPALTIEPYAIANDMPVQLVSNITLAASDSPQLTSDFFFTGGRFSGTTIIVAWEHQHIPKIADALLASYFPTGTPPAFQSWGGSDYDTIWTVTLDGKGNVTVDNALCEGIDSAKLPADAPRF